MTATPEQLARWNTQKPDGTYPCPWFSEATDAYSFDVADFPAPDDCRAYGLHTWGPVEGDFGTGSYSISGPEDVEVDDHDEDEPCDPSPEECAKRRIIRAWIVEPDYWYPADWYDLTSGERRAMSAEAGT